MKRIPWRDHIVTALIAFVSSVFGVTLIQGAQLIRDLIGDQPGIEFIHTALNCIAGVFIGIGAFTAAVVTANTFTTIVAGRVREIAQYRLLGAMVGKLRSKLALEGLMAALVGSVLGWITALVAYRILVEDAIRRGDFRGAEHVNFTWVSLYSPIPALIAIGTVWVAAYVGSRAVAKVSPIQALSADVETPVERRTVGSGQIVAFGILGGIGLILLLVGLNMGLRSPAGVVIAFFGGVFSFTGIVVGATLIVPRLLNWTGHLFGSSAPASLARQNATRLPRAATRNAIGMIVGVALIVMFIVGTETMRDILWRKLETMTGSVLDRESQKRLFEESMRGVLGTMLALTCVSVVLATIGMVSNLALAVLQRRREIGLLRAIGMSGGQVRGMIFLESTVTAIVAVGLGTVLGIVYGWIGAQSMFASLQNGFSMPIVPWEMLVGVLVAALILALVSAVGPAIRATRTTPIEALAVS